MGRAQILFAHFKYLVDSLMLIRCDLKRNLRQATAWVAGPVQMESEYPQ